MTIIERAERRSKPRVFLAPGFRIRFQVEGRAFEALPITNLSVDGCFATLPQGEASRFAPGTILENLILDHPDLPHAPMTGRTSYVLDQMPGLGDMELIGMGIHFLTVDPATTESLQSFVAQQFATPSQP